MDPDRAKLLAEKLAYEGFDVDVKYRGEQAREGPAEVTMTISGARGLDLGSLRTLLNLLDREQADAHAKCTVLEPSVQTANSERKGRRTGPIDAQGVTLASWKTCNVRSEQPDFDAMGSETRARAKGFVLVLVVDQTQAGDDHASLARVCSDYDVGSIAELQDAIRVAGEQACNQLALGEALLNVVRRARAAWN